MSENNQKNSLLAQLEQRGIINESSNEGNMLPFGVLTGNLEQNSPFVLPKKNENERNKPQETNGQKIVKKRLNELDYNIFQEGNYLDIEDVELTGHEKIKKIKEMIKQIDEKIFMLEDFEDELLIKKLKDEKEILIQTIALLEKEEPQNPFISGVLSVDKISDKIHFKEKMKKIENCVFKFFPVLRKNYLVRHALNKLVKLNESAKNISSKQIPYGEQEGRYSDFTAYLACANVIHAKLSKKI